MKQTGFGFVKNYTAMYSFDRTRSESFTGDYVTWPPKNMPNEIYTQSSYGYAFSVSLNSSYEYPSLENITVDLSSKLLNKSWHLDKTSTDMKTNYLTVNNDGYGMNRCIIFNVGQFPENDTVSVNINGLKRMVFQHQSHMMLISSTSLMKTASIMSLVLKRITILYMSEILFQ